MPLGHVQEGLARQLDDIARHPGEHRVEERVVDDLDDVLDVVAGERAGDRHAEARFWLLRSAGKIGEGLGVPVYCYDEAALSPERPGSAGQPTRLASSG